MEVSIPLKLKYRQHKNGEKHKSKSSNQGTSSKLVVKTLKPRKRAYGPW